MYQTETELVTGDVCASLFVRNTAVTVYRGIRAVEWRSE